MDKHFSFAVVTAIFCWAFCPSLEAKASQAAWVALDRATQRILILDGVPETTDFSDDSLQIPVAWATFQDDIDKSGGKFLAVSGHGQANEPFLENGRTALTSAHIRRNREKNTGFTGFYIDARKLLPVLEARWSKVNEKRQWAYLQVESNEQVDDEVQAYAAGALEATLTRQLIEDHWTNMLAFYCDDNAAYCDRLKDFMTKHIQYLQREEQLHREDDPFWNMAYLQMKQLAGISDAMENNTLDFSRELSGPTRAFYLNSLGALQALEVVLGRVRNLYSLDQIVACSALIKVVGDTRDIYFAHDTWFLYRAMLRIQKKYIFPWHRTAGQTSSEDVIPGHTIAMSTYPAMISSWDSYHLTSAGLAITETELVNDNAELWKLVTPDSGMLGWERIAIANRLATSGEEWVLTVSRENGGSGDTQIMVLDYKLFTPGKPLADGTLWVYEQMPGLSKYADLTGQLRNATYWASYNVAYFEEIFEISGQPAKVEKYGNFYSYEDCPRAKMFKRDHSKLKDLNSVLAYMGYNDYENDPLSRCNCTPPYNPVYAIAARYDLLSPSGVYQDPDMYPRGVGGIDAKVTSSRLFESLEFVAVSGPTSISQPPFQWSTSGLLDNHVGHPDKFDFGPVHHKWKPALRKLGKPAPVA